MERGRSVKWTMKLTTRNKREIKSERISTQLLFEIDMIRSHVRPTIVGAPRPRSKTIGVVLEPYTVR